MQYSLSNHGKTEFMATTDDIGQSLINDFWSIVNCWQNAADNGYGLGQWWGTSASVALVGFDWFCSSILRNLVAMSVYFALFVVYVGQRAWNIYSANGRAERHAVVVIDAGQRLIEGLIEEVKPVALEVAATVAVVLATLDAPLVLAFDIPLPTVPADAHLIDGVPADIWMMRRIIVH